MKGIRTTLALALALVTLAAALVLGGVPAQAIAETVFPEQEPLELEGGEGDEETPEGHFADAADSGLEEGDGTSSLNTDPSGDPTASESDASSTSESADETEAVVIESCRYTEYRNGDVFYARIRHTNSGKSITRQGENVALYAGNASTRGNDIWRFERGVRTNGEDYYLIRSPRDGKAISVDGSSPGDGTNVCVRDPSVSDAQQFDLWTRTDGNKSGTVFITPSWLGRGVDLALDVEGGNTADGTNVQVFARNDSNAQCFAIDVVPELVNDGDFTALIINKANGMPIVRDSKNNVVVGKEDGPAYKSSLWSFKYNRDLGCYCIYAPQGNMALDVSNGTDKNGANVQLWEANGTTAQDWYLFRNADGTVAIRPGMSYKSLDVDRGSSAVGTNVQIWDAAEWGNPIQTFTIRRTGTQTTPIVFATATFEDSYVYTGKEITPNPSVVLGEATLRNGTDYTLSYANNVNVGTATATITGKGAYSGTRTVTFKIGKAPIVQVELHAIKAQAYTGDAVTPDPKLTLGNKTLVKDVDYTLSYANNVQVGTASVTITGVGNFRGSREQAFEIVVPTITYRTHIQSVGWQAWKKSGATSGTTGKGLRMEAMSVKIAGAEVSGGITYRAHVQNVGWQAWKQNGTASGTTGKGLQMEAVQIQLTGQLSMTYDVWYRVHAQRFGWMGWTKNGTKAGTTGYGYRLEAIQIKLLPKGAQSPGGTDNVFHNHSSENKKIRKNLSVYLTRGSKSVNVNLYNTTRLPTFTVVIAGKKRTKKATLRKWKDENGKTTVIAHATFNIGRGYETNARFSVSAQTMLGKATKTFAVTGTPFASAGTFYSCKYYMPVTFYNVLPGDRVTLEIGSESYTRTVGSTNDWGSYNTTFYTQKTMGHYYSYTLSVKSRNGKILYRYNQVIRWRR